MAVIQAMVPIRTYGRANESLPLYIVGRIQNRENVKFSLKIIMPAAVTL